MLIAYKKDQIKYQEDVPIANVPAELVCMWFDDHYYPDTEWFKEAFNESERKLLNDFSSYYESRLENLPDTNDIYILHRSDIWDEIVNKAEETVRNLFTICNDI